MVATTAFILRKVMEINFLGRSPNTKVIINQAIKYLFCFYTLSVPTNTMNEKLTLLGMFVTQCCFIRVFTSFSNVYQYHFQVDSHDIIYCSCRYQYISRQWDYTQLKFILICLQSLHCVSAEKQWLSMKCILPYIVLYRIRMQ